MVSYYKRILYSSEKNQHKLFLFSKTWINLKSIMMRTKKQVTEEYIHYDSIQVKFELWQKQNYTDTYTLNHKGINITTNSRLWLLLGKTYRGLQRN